MHLSEFKAWFDGFTEEMKGTPNKDQWAKIKKRVKEISADYTPPTVFINRYWYPTYRYWDYTPAWSGGVGTNLSGWTTGGLGGTSGTLGSGTGGVSSGSYSMFPPNTTISTDDWKSAGRAEFRAE